MEKISLLPARINIAIRRGDDHALTFGLQDETGAPDISADTVRLVVRDEHAEIVGSMESAPGAHHDPTVGRVRFTLSSALTKDLPARLVVWTYELRRIVPSAAGLTYVVGDLEVHP